jgi:hypothetical protein
MKCFWIIAHARIILYTCIGGPCHASKKLPVSEGACGEYPKWLEFFYIKLHRSGRC